jgi:tripartite-type tricarboxylate transporter receptor subunit TctC
MLKTGVKMLHTPYKGGSEAVVAVVSGQADVFFAGLPPALPQIAAGKVKALAVSTRDRVVQMPDVPTLAESGVAGVDISNWFALFAPAGVPRPVIDRLHKAVDDAVAAPEVKELYAKEGIVAQPMTVIGLEAFIAGESSRYKALLASAHIKLD